MKNILRTTAVIVIVSLLLMCGGAFAMSLGDSKYAFADKTVENAVRVQLGKYTGPVYRSDLDSIEFLYFEDTSIDKVYDILNCRNLTSITFANTVVSDFGRLGTMNQLESLVIIECPIDDGYFANGFYGLRELHIEGCELDGIDDIGNARGLRLERLSVINCGITDISSLAGQQGLVYLDISGNPIADLSVAENLPVLETLVCENMWDYGDDYWDAPVELWGLAVKNISTRTGPSTKYEEGGTYMLEGQYVKVLQRAWDEPNDIWWVQVEINYKGETRYLWTGYHRFDSSTLPLESIPIYDSVSSSGAASSGNNGAYFEGVWGLAVKNISTRTGPSTKYEEGGTYKLSGQYVKVLKRSWDEANGIWWVQVEINYGGETRYLWTGYHRFDSSTLPLESIPVAK